MSQQISFDKLTNYLYDDKIDSNSPTFSLNNVNGQPLMLGKVIYDDQKENELNFKNENSNDLSLTVLKDRNGDIYLQGNDPHEIYIGKSNQILISYEGAQQQPSPQPK